MALKKTLKIKPNQLPSTLREKTERWIRSRGLKLPSNPNFKDDELDVPADLTTLNNIQLNNLMNRITILADYIETELARASIDELDAETAYEIYTAKLYLTIKAKNKKMAVSVDDKAVKLQNDFNVASAKVKLLKAMVNSRDKQYKALSRDQTRRQHQLEKAKSY